MQIRTPSLPAFRCHPFTECGDRVWGNTLDVSYFCDVNDTMSGRDPDAIWGTRRAAGVNAIQTDDPPLLIEWVHARKVAA